jgi:chitodextrinase
LLEYKYNLENPVQTGTQSTVQDLTTAFKEFQDKRPTQKELNERGINMSVDQFVTEQSNNIKTELTPDEQALVEALKNYTLDPSKLP